MRSTAAAAAVVCLLSACTADHLPVQTYSAPPAPSYSAYRPPAQYQYSYQVLHERSDNDYSAQEQRHGDSAIGRYQIGRARDGFTHSVDYRVDGGSGYRANTRYSLWPPRPPYKTVFPTYYKPAYPRAYHGL